MFVKLLCLGADDDIVENEEQLADAEKFIAQTEALIDRKLSMRALYVWL